MRVWQTFIKNKYEFFLAIQNIRNKGYAERHDLFRLENLGCSLTRGRFSLWVEISINGTLDLEYFEKELDSWKNRYDSFEKLKIISEERLKLKIARKRFKIKFYRAVKAGIIYQLIIKIKNKYDRHNKQRNGRTTKKIY